MIMEPMPSEASVEEMKWYELLMPLYEPGDEMGYLGDRQPHPPQPTPIDPEDPPLSTLLTGSEEHGHSDDFYNQGNTVEQSDMSYQCLEEPPMTLPECTTWPFVEMQLNDHPSPPTKVYTSNRRRKRDVQEDGSKAYIKKPPNAFMIFRQEQRLKVMAQFDIRDSAVANKVLGHMWKSLSEPEQEKYYQQADVEKRLHSQMHPNWSCTDNYGRKRRKQMEDLPIGNPSMKV
ncbi:transcription factor 7-like 1-B isoform X2 [Entelurus aequoreus]|uniref:transcription factor 7-like 1-B isoform X2 n=1 Tax=Entelurus aequoreus TaxID=161455 RepID=UPI002B1D0E12|nr:transcription factor 7-like 1-B isoform X2 [Entelurus aequoreus]